MSTETATAKTFQYAVKQYEATMTDMIDNRQRLKDTLRNEIDKLNSVKEAEEIKRKKVKTKLQEANVNYSTFRTRDLTKLRKTYTHKCEELKTSQINFQQQLQQQQDEIEQQQQQSSNRLSGDFSRLSTEYTRDIDVEHKKGMAGLISQMRTRAANSHSAPLDQNKQNTKVAKMKKDITDADNEYRDGVLTLESLRKKQNKTVEESLKSVEDSIKTKSNSVRTSLLSITQTEYMTLNTEKEMASRSFSAAKNIDSTKDTLAFTNYYHSLGFLTPQPIRYENFYFEGKCREVLFGGSLESYSIEHNAAVPLVVTKCIEGIENMGGLQKEGIYRISGRQTNVEQLKHQFEMGEEMADLESFDVFTIATVLKMFIRELKRPLFDFNVQTRLNYSKSMSHNQRLGVLESKLATLSYAHRSTLHQVIVHLAKVNEYSQINKMNIQNLAVIFTPVIFHDFNQVEDHHEWCPDDLFEDLILYHENLFVSSEVLAQKLNEPKLKAALSGQSPYTQFSQSNLLYITRGQPNANTPVATTATPATRNMLLTQPMNPPIVMDYGSSSANNNSMIPENNMYYSPQPQQQQVPPPPPPPQQQQQQQQQQGTAPAALTTIIGSMPTHHQRNSSLSSNQPVYPINRNVAPATPVENRITPQRYRVVENDQEQQPNKSISDNTKNRTSSYDVPYSMDTRMTSSTPTLPPNLLHNRVSTEFKKTNIPPRQDSLRKSSARNKSEKTLVQEGEQTTTTTTTTTTSKPKQIYQPTFNPDLLSTIDDDLESKENDI
ncbi:RhoGAP-domain-containing protein [Backusella circina FSU 941]|nr:RhoGAP-domain-containing protein [Backusella circina FSU 941]